jgi:hypothetical protein
MQNPETPTPAALHLLQHLVHVLVWLLECGAALHPSLLHKHIPQVKVTLPIQVLRNHLQPNAVKCGQMRSNMVKAQSQRVQLRALAHRGGAAGPRV